MFKDSWNLHFSEWSFNYDDWFAADDNPDERFHRPQPVPSHEISPGNRLAGWFRGQASTLSPFPRQQRRHFRNNAIIEEEPYPEHLKTPTRTFSISYSDSSNEGGRGARFYDEDEIMDTKINLSPILWLIQWFHNRNTVQKIMYVTGAFGFFLILLASGLVLGETTNDSGSSNASSNSNSSPDFSFPDQWLNSKTLPPTQSPTRSSLPPIFKPESHTYVPGNLTTNKFGIMLSEGLDAKILAFANERVNFDQGGRSIERFHIHPDAGATFPDERPENEGGWIYVSNSEVEKQKGGVGAITFDKNGRVIDYTKLLRETSMNCGGGRTPWNTWVSCEEVEGSGQIYQVHPTGERSPQLLTFGSDGGSWESFAYDVRNQDIPSFFVTEDTTRGALRRFIPESPNWDEPWSMLHGNGTVDYLMLVPNSTNDGGMFVWTTDEEAGKMNAALYYPNTEGIDVAGNILYFVCKNIKQLFVLNLDEGTYYSDTTMNGLFDGNPDQIQHMLSPSQDLLYFTEENGKNSGVHARDKYGNFHTVFESLTYKDETTGLSFSPNGQFMYIAYQQTGLLFALWRSDGYAFHAAHLDIKYHQSSLAP